MGLVTATKDSKAKLSVRISLLDPEWQELHPEQLTPFQIQELIRPCSAYPDGLFPGASLDPDNKTRQVTRVYRFPNYLEWSRVTEDDVEDAAGDGKQYLTSHFFDQRKCGWSELSPTVKQGKTVGYCFNGTAYSIQDKESIRTIVYQTVYKSIVKDKRAFKRLQEIFNNCVTVELTGADDEVLRVLAETLLESGANN
jgi:hypothetical protein